MFEKIEIWTINYGLVFSFCHRIHSAMFDGVTLQIKLSRSDTELYIYPKGTIQIITFPPLFRPSSLMWNLLSFILPPSPIVWCDMFFFLDNIAFINLY